ncbi:efflux RND transporter periplasmic adaptor subunit [Desulfopila sp. IMCC35008]|uniref:efflux RND transporter periplasmic adaptor subunit n=1 Tax=Desulfopila sp. IMCC35008 TaxID=2653858 RepID=UPI0013D0D08C|nr:efflux RND transporter periplasmic adaptor subunit [Desulfopila sp. IMCC35008]
MGCIRFGVLLIFCIGLMLPGCSEERDKAETTQQAPPPLPVEVVIASKDQIPIWLEFTGKTVATKRVEIRARVSGRLEQILFQEGDFVEEGETLFTLEKDQYEATLAQAKAQLQQNEATLSLARKDVERYEPLVAEELAPRATLEQYEAKVAELEAAIKANNATIREAELNLSYTDIVAPISGTIGRSLIDVGNIVGYGEPTLLTTIVNDNPMFAYFNPTERQFQLMRQYKSQDKMDARVTVREKADGLLKRESLRGQVGFTDNKVDQQTGTITMRAEVANHEHTMLEGTFVYVEVMVTDRPSFIMVQPSAIQEDQRSSFVYVVGEDNLAKRVDIEKGYENRHYAMITKGLEGGEKVIVSGLAKVSNGRNVQAVDVTATKGIRAQLAESGMLEKTE